MSKHKMNSPQEDETRSSRKSSTIWRRICFPLAAIALGLMPFLVAESILGFFDIGNPEAVADPYVGFSSVNPLFVEDPSAGVYRTSRARLTFFNEESFPIEKPTDEFRIFCLGGSTVHGRPYQGDTSFTKWLELELQATDPGHRYRVINCGGLSYASYRLRLLLDEIMAYDPDLIIVATGHNEFLEDRTYHEIKSDASWSSSITKRVYSSRLVTLARQAVDQSSRADSDQSPKSMLAAEVATKLDQSSGFASYRPDDAWRKDVIRHFRHSIEGMVSVCESHDVPLMLVALGCNLRGCPPFKSEPWHKPEESQWLRWQQLYDQASELDRTDTEGALALYLKAEQIEPRDALLCWRIARCYDRLGESHAAAIYYVKSKEFDVCPLRSITAVNQALADIAADRSIPFLDAKSLVERIAADQIPGNDTFVDHVHPTIAVHQQIGQAIADVLTKSRIVSRSQSWTDSERRDAYQRHMDALGDRYFNAALRRIEWLEGWAKRQHLLVESIPETNRTRLDQAKKRFGLGQQDEGIKLFEGLLQQDPAEANQVLDYAWELFEQGSEKQAGLLLRWMIGNIDAQRHPDLRTKAAVAALALAVNQGNLALAREIKDRYIPVESGSVDPGNRWIIAVPESGPYLGFPAPERLEVP